MIKTFDDYKYVGVGGTFLDDTLQTSGPIVGQVGFQHTGATTAKLLPL